MIMIRWKILALAESTSLCATCTWGLVRKGYRAEEEAFCRLVEPNAAVPFPVSQCTGYVDNRAPSPAASGRGIGFITLGVTQKTEDVET
jgi:hypothetical protein